MLGLCEKKDVKDDTMDENRLNLLTQLARGIASQFGSNCEIVIHDLKGPNPENTVVAIENGHVTGRSLGDGPSHVVLEALKKDPDSLTDHLDYITKTKDGKMLKSSTMYIRDAAGQPEAIFAINYDITSLLMVENALGSLIGQTPDEPAENIPNSVADLLDDLLTQAVRLVGKPVALMTKADKVRAINFLNDAGALLVTKSSEKISQYFDISKYTLYSYIDQNDSKEKSKS